MAATLHRGGLLLLFALLAACRSRSTAPPPPTDASPAGPPVSASASASPTPSFALRDIPPPPPPTAGPIRVEGYPTPVTAGISDPVDRFGFTKDGRSFVYCASICCQEGARQCRLVDENNHETTMTSGLERLEADLSTVRAVPDYKVLPAAATGTFAYGGDMTIVVRELAGKEDHDAGEHSTAGSVQIGARLDGESAPVYVVHPSLPESCREMPFLCTLVQVNGLAASADGSALGYVTFVALPSHGSGYSSGRIQSGVFAARVFNDTGMRHHQKKEWPRAAELFTRAIYTDPSQELFAYNLACALARQGDARAEHPLRHALSLNRSAVKKRAATDADFAAVRTASWFVTALNAE